MNRRAVISIIFILISVLCLTAFFACDNQTDNGLNLANRTLKSISVEGVDKDHPIMLTKGEDLVLQNYQLRVILDNDSEFTVEVNNGMFRTPSDLDLVKSVGTHTLTLTYSLNNSELNTLLYVVVTEPVVVLPKYNVTFDMGGVTYAEQLRDRTVDTLSTPSITYTDATMSYMTAEWYASSSFAPSSKITFPLQVTSDRTLYAKWVDNRRVTVEYHVMRTVDGTIVNASGEPTTREDLPIEASMTVTNRKVKDAPTAEPLSDLVVLSTTPSAIVAGYTFTRQWQVYNYDTDTYETITRETLGGIYDFYLDEKYLKDKSAISSTIALYCVYQINSYAITFDGVNAVYSLTLASGMTVMDGAVVVGSNQYRIDEQNNVVIDSTNYHVVGTDVYLMTEAIATIEVTRGDGTVTLDGTTYYVQDGALYLDSAYATKVDANVITSASTPTYYVHTPYLDKPYNYQFTADNMLYILDKVDKTGRFEINGQIVSYPYYVRSDVTFTANYVTKTYPVTFYRYDGSLMGAVTKEHGSLIADSDFTSIGLGNLSGYTYKWVLDGTEYDTSNDLYGIAVTSPLEIREERTPNKYSNKFFYQSTLIDEIDTDFGQVVNRPDTAKIAETIPSLSNDYYVFEWYSQIGNANSLLLDTQTQNDGAVDYYLVAIDRRTLVVTVTIPEHEAADTAHRSATDLAVSIGRTYTVNPSALNLSYLIEFESDPSQYTIGGTSVTATFTFDDAFITAYASVLTYDAETFTYSAEVITPGKIKKFTIRFKDELDDAYSTSAEVEYGEVPAVVYDTTARTKDGKTYHFAGWYNESHTIHYGWDKTTSAYAFDTATIDKTYCAVWRSEEEGSFDIVYEPYESIDGVVTSYAMTGYNGFATDVYVGSTYQGLPVVAILYYAFKPDISHIDSAPEIVSITIPSSVQYIEESAFDDCYYLQRITVDSAYFVAIDGVLYQKNTDSDFTLLAYPSQKTGDTYAVDSRTTAIAADAFTMYHGTSIDLGSVTAIGDRAFKKSSLTSITLPSTLTTIGAKAFAESQALATVTVNSTTISKVGEGAFDDTAWLDNTLVGADVAMLGNVLLKYVGTAADYTVAEGVYAIADKAFAKCTSLLNLTIVGTNLTVDRIGVKVFDGCSALATVIIEDATLKTAVTEKASTIFVNVNAGYVII